MRYFLDYSTNSKDNFRLDVFKLLCKFCSFTTILPFSFNLEYDSKKIPVLNETFKAFCNKIVEFMIIRDIVL